MKITDLVKDPVTGMLSGTRLMAAGAFFVATFCIIYETIHGRLTDWLFMAFIINYSGSVALAKYLGYKYGGINADSLTSKTGAASNQ